MHSVRSMSIVLLALCGATFLAAAPAKPPAPPADQRELLSQHQTVAKLKSIAYQQCRGMTAQCPNDCGQSGDFATFEIVAYVKYAKPGQYGDPKSTTFTFQVEDNKKNLKLDKAMADKVRALKAGDFVLLDWNHDYVTRTEAGGGSSKFPERPLVKLESITAAEADKLAKAGEKL